MLARANNTLEKSRALPRRLYPGAKRPQPHCLARVLCRAVKDGAVYGLACRRMNVVGKPYEGKPHVRFDVARDGDQDMGGLLRHSQRKRGATDRPGLRPRRHSLTLHLTWPGRQRSTVSCLPGLPSHSIGMGVEATQVMPPLAAKREGADASLGEQGTCSPP